MNLQAVIFHAVSALITSLFTMTSLLIVAFGELSGWNLVLVVVSTAGWALLAVKHLSAINPAKAEATR